MKSSNKTLTKMNYERKTSTTYRSNPSVYSHGTGRSSINLHSSRSVHSVRNIAWYQKPIFHNQCVDVQKTALIIAFFSVFVAIFTISTSIFDVHCLAMATPGSTHYGYYVISYEFVYVGNIHVRNALIIFALFSLILGVIILTTSILLIIALRKEYERKIIPWLWTFAVFTIVRLFAFLFFSLVNDLIFVYNVLMVLCWIIIFVTSVYGWVLIYSLYIELADLTKLEDLAHLRMGIMASLNASTTQSLVGSRPITPHSTVSTMPVG